jgi:hypothetical protein
MATTAITRIWCVNEEEDSAANLTMYWDVQRYRTLEEAEAYVRQHQRIGQATGRPLLFIDGPWHDTGAGCARIDGETRSYYPD